MTLKYDESVDPGDPPAQDWAILVIVIASILFIFYVALSQKEMDCEKLMCDVGQSAVYFYGECICSEGITYAQ